MVPGIHVRLCKTSTFLVSKGKKESSASSPSVLVMAVPTAPVVFPPSLTVSTTVHFRQYVHSVLGNLFTFCDFQCIVNFSCQVI